MFESAQIPFALATAKTKAIVLAFGFFANFPVSASLQKNVLVWARSVFSRWLQIYNVERGNVTPTKSGVRNADPETRRQTAARMIFGFPARGNVA